MRIPIRCGDQEMFLILDPLTPQGELGWRIVQAVRSGNIRLEQSYALPAPHDVPEAPRLRREESDSSDPAPRSETRTTAHEDDHQEEDKLRHQLVTCGHHASKGVRPLFEDLGSIQVVPSKDEHEDQIEVHWRDDYLGSMPHEIYASCGGVEHAMAKTGTSGPYSVYALDAKWDGEHKIFFWMQSFWTEYNRKTIYRVHGAMRGVEVQVFNPARYKLELSLPPLKSFKAGRDLKKGIERDPAGKRQLAPHWHKGKETETARWSPSKLSVTTTKTENGHAHGAPETDRMELPISFKVDGIEEKIDVINVIGKLIYLVDSIMEIMADFQNKAPKVGWIFEFEVQFLQGGAATEWYWKEHEDHRVFQYIDINVSMTLFKVKLEAGFGIEGLSFKAMAFAEVEGELKLSMNGCRDNPSAEYSIGFPIKFEIKGAVGAKFEAGNHVHAVLKGETGFELKLDIGLNRNHRPGWTTEGAIEWLGVKVVLEASASFFGLGGTYTHETELCGPSELSEFRFPERHDHKAAVISRALLKKILLDTIYDDWDLRVEGMEANAIAETLVDKLDANHHWHRTTAVAEGLAIAIRGDLEAMYVDGGMFSFDHVPVAKFVAYTRGAALQAHMNAAAHPAAHLTQSAHH